MGASKLITLAVIVAILAIVALNLLEMPSRGPSIVTETSTAIQYIAGIREWNPKMAEYLAVNVSLHRPGDVIRIAGFEVVIEDVKILDVLEYNFTREGKTVVVKQTPFMARWTKGEPEIAGKAVDVYVEVIWRKVSEEEAPGLEGEVGPGPLAYVFAPWLLLFPTTQPLEPSLLDIVVSFNGKWIENRKFSIDPGAPHDQIGLKANISVGWEGRGKILFIIPEEYRNKAEVVVTVRASCPLGAEHPLCQPGLPIARIKIQD